MNSFMLCLLLAIYAIQNMSAQPNAVGMSQTLPADATAQTVANQVLPLVIQAIGSQVSQYTPISYRQQPSATGANYFIKAFLSSPTIGSQYVHMRTSQTGNLFNLDGLELNRQANDPISYIFAKRCPNMAG